MTASPDQMINYLAFSWERKLNISSTQLLSQLTIGNLFNSFVVEGLLESHFGTCYENVDIYIHNEIIHKMCEKCCDLFWLSYIRVVSAFMKIHLPIFFRVTLLPLGQSYNHPSASEVTLKDLHKIDWSKPRQTTILGMYCSYQFFIT